MPEPIISVEKLSKRYTLNRRTERYTTLRDTVAGMFRPRETTKQEPFWALREVSFDVQRGEVLGVIGRNGAGKSTLLKLLSRITEPTEGRIVLRGRIASLLEVGTGFHPELSGRENIYLNGAILGMKRSEITARFDEIVAFAEIEKFLDTPVKRYSSGMYVRLAFSVAAHLEPEILVVDEVLAVGDATFQSRCLGKMQDVARNSGRTVFLVSHNLAAIRQLTTRCLVMEGGRLTKDDMPEEAIASYLSSARSGSDEDDVTSRPRPVKVSGEATFVSLRLDNGACVLTAGEELRVRAIVEAHSALAEVRASFMISTQEGVAVGSAFGDFTHSLCAGRQTVHVCVPARCLAPGHFHCAIALSRMIAGSAQVIDAVADVLPFEVIGGEGTQNWPREWGSVKFPKLEVAVSA
jgi:lipopolysaccharide transport system ATP-binding protein